MKAVLFVLSWLLAGAATAAFRAFLLSGVVVDSGNAKRLERFTRLLSEKANYPMHVVYPSSYTELSNLLREHPESVGRAFIAPADEYARVEYAKAHPEAPDKLQIIERLGPFPFTPDVAGLHTIAEFVESQEILDALQRVGVDFAQGDHIQRPEPLSCPG